MVLVDGMWTQEAGKKHILYTIYVEEKKIYKGSAEKGWLVNGVPACFEIVI